MKKNRLKINLKNIIEKINIRHIILLYFIISIILVEFPGLYMDAVNPDYISVHLKNPGKIQVWVYNDNIIASLLGKNWNYPLLNSLYGINLPAYICSLTGTLIGNGLMNIRFTHILYGILEILAIYYFMIKCTKSKKISLICSLYLALEPSFIFAQRTQYYLQLFPVIFFGIGLGCINKIDFNKNNNIKKIILLSILFGISASCYFVFAFYYAAIIITFLIYLGLNKKNIKNIFCSILGFIIGYIPFLYAHLSLLINNGIHGYINLLKSLDTYGITSGQTGIFSRVYDVIKEVILLENGNTIIKTITGKNVTLGYSYIVFYLFLFVLFLISLYQVIKQLKISKRKINNITLSQLIIIIIIIIHGLLGIVVGESLEYQHYVMLIPLFYSLIFITIFQILKNGINKKCKFTICLILLIIFISNIINIYSGYKRIDENNGIDYYSSSINDMGSYLKTNASNNDLIICPQWGYLMGLSVITDGKTEIWSDIKENDIILKLKNSNEIYNHIYITVDNRFKGSDFKNIKKIVKASGKKNYEEISFKNVGNTYDIKLVVLN